MNYTKYALLTLLFTYSLQATKNPGSLDRKEMWSNATAVLGVYVWGSFKKIGRFKLGDGVKVLGIMPSFYIGKKAGETIFDVSQILYNQLKIRQK